MLGHEDSWAAARAVLLEVGDIATVVDRVKAQGKALDLLVDMLVFLLGGVGFLLLLFLSSVEAGSHVQIAQLFDALQRGQNETLVDEVHIAWQAEQVSQLRD